VFGLRPHEKHSHLEFSSSLKRTRHFLLALAMNAVISKQSGTQPVYPVLLEWPVLLGTDALGPSRCWFSSLNYQAEATAWVSQTTASGEPEWRFSCVTLKAAVLFSPGSYLVCIMNVGGVQAWSVIRRQGRDWKWKSCLSLLQSWRGRKLKGWRQWSILGARCVDFGEVRVITLPNLSLKPLAACGQIIND